NEHDGVKTEVQLLDHIDDVRRLVIPVDAPCREVVQSQDHLRMPLDRLERHGLVVLTNDREYYSSSGQGLQLSLKVHKRLATRIVPSEREILPALISHDAAPQGVVQVDDPQLPGPPANSAKRGLDILGGRLEHFVRERDLGHVPKPRVEGLLAG